MRLFLLFATALVICISAECEAGAEMPVECEVLTIEASSSGQGVDLPLRGYEGIFKQRPFAEYNSFKLVHRQVYSLLQEKPVPLNLPLTLDGQLRLDGRDAKQLKLTLSLGRKGTHPIDIQGKASPSSPFFAAGFKTSGGIWVFAVACAHAKLSQNNGIVLH